MQIKKTWKEPTKLSLMIVASPVELHSLKELVLTSLAKDSVKVQGFRAGKAPLALVEKQLEPSVLQSRFLDEALNQFYSQAIDQGRLRPVNQPEVSITKFVPFDILEFTAEVDAVGDIKLGNYKNLKLTKPPVSITSKDVDDVVINLQQRAAEKKPVTRAAKDGDELLIDFKGVDAKGEPVNGADGTDYPLILGSNNFIPGFESKLLGLKAGQEKTFTITFPKEYGVSALRSKKVTFTVAVKKVQELTGPKLDDVFAASVGPFTSLAQLKVDIKKQLTLQRQGEADQKFANDLLMKVTEDSAIAVPQSLVDEQLERMEQEERRNLAYRGQTWAEHLVEEGLDDEKHRERERPQAEQRVKAGLVLGEIAEQEQLLITPEELDERFAQLKAQYKDAQMQAELAKPEARRDITGRLLTEKTLAILVNHATK